MKRKKENKIKHFEIGDYVLITTDSNISFSGKIIHKTKIGFLETDGEKIILKPSDKSNFWLIFDKDSIKSLDVLIRCKEEV